AVGVVLVVLGVQMLWETAEPALVRHVHGTDAHAHEGVGDEHHPHGDEHHPHSHETHPSPAHESAADPIGGHHDPHRHLHLGGLSLGSTHSHVDDTSFFVGVLHGLAGSGFLVIALVSAAPSVFSAVAFLVAFSTLSILTMGAVSYLWGRSLEWGVTTALQALAGVMGVGVGGLLIATNLLGMSVL
ncbi:MAG: hypothetical protein R3324_18170, partial [Halobacteriales archaeon]|nr:hypothetical protein [Halobacteriales archaeon]